MTQKKIVEAEFPEKLRFLFQPKRYKVAYGGRGGSKSWGFARALLVLASMNPLRVLCCREIQKSIKDSVHKLLKDQIAELSLDYFFTVTETSIKGKNGSEFFFSGLAHNSTHIKSYEGIDVAWVEEAHLVSKSSWEILIPTIRAYNSEIWVTFNPELDDDETYQRFVVNPPDDSIVVKLDWRDNPWFPEVLEKERLELKRKDHDAYLTVWEGQCRQILEGAIFGNEIRLALEQNRITNVPYDPLFPVDTYWDLGWADFTSIWFVQPLAMEFRVIDFYQNHLQGIQHYLSEMQNRRYVYRKVFLPHDADHAQLAAGGRTILQQVRAAGFNASIVERIPTKMFGVNAARAVFPMCFFDQAKCNEGLRALKLYRFEYDPDTGKYSDKPAHDWASHAADAFQQLGVSIRVAPTQKQIENRKHKKEWSPWAVLDQRKQANGIR